MELLSAVNTTFGLRTRMRQLVSLSMYMNSIFFLFLAVPLSNVTVTGLNYFRRYPSNPYDSYSFQQTDSHNTKSDTTHNENDNNGTKPESDKSSNELGPKSGIKVPNPSDSDHSGSASEKSNPESNATNVNDKDKNVDTSKVSNEADYSAESTTNTTADEKNKNTDALVDNVILNPSVNNVDFTIKTLRNETGNAINSLKHVCTQIQELISIMPQDVKSAEIELVTHKVVTSDLYNECVKHLTTLEGFENDLDKFATQAQISLMYPQST